MKKHVRDLMQLKPYITFRAIILDWFTIFISISVATYYEHFLISLIVIVIVGSRQHSLSALSHDFVHRLVFKNRLLAEYIGNLFTTWPLFYRVAGFRSQHLMHHKYLNSDDDPDLSRRQGLAEWQFPRSRKSVYLTMIKDVLGLHFYQNFKKLYTLHHKKSKQKKNFKKEPRHFLISQACYYCSIAAILTVTHHWDTYFLYWIVPFFTFHKLSKRIRAISEHFSIPRNNYGEETRTTMVNAIEGFLFFPRNVNYHLEHHLYPQVPWYHLKKLHYLIKDDVVKNKYGHYTQGVGNLLQEAAT